MKALYVTHNPGSRAARFLEATSRKGMEWHLLHRVSYRHDPAKLARITRWENAEQLRELIGQSAAGLVVVTQQLDTEWLPPWVSLHRNKKARMVVDVRDMASLIPRIVEDALRGRFMLECCSMEEMATFRAADGVIHISPTIAETATLLHRINKQRSIVLPCYPLEEELIPTAEHPPLEERVGLVYSGGIGSCDEATFRNYGELFEQLVLGGIPVHIQSAISPEHPATEWILQQYRGRGCVVHERVPDAQLTAQLAQFKWGLVGFPGPFPLGNGALPNKLFEYLAAGVVPVAIHAATAGKWLEHYRCGVWVKNAEELEQLPETLTDQRWRHCYKNLLQHREKWTMDAHAGPIVNWFKKLTSMQQAFPGGLWMGRPTIEDPHAGAA